MIKLEREDWEKLKESAEAGLKTAHISTLQYQALLTMSEKALAKLPDVVDETLKEIDKEIEKDET